MIEYVVFEELLDMMNSMKFEKWVITFRVENNMIGSSKVYLDQVYSNTGVLTRINTGQHKWTQINVSLTRVNASSSQVITNQDESTRLQHESTQSSKSPKQVKTIKNRKTLPKKRQNITQQWYGRLHLLGFRFLLKIYEQLNF